MGSWNGPDSWEYGRIVVDCLTILFYPAQLEIIGLHLRHGRNISDRTAAHDSKPRVSSHQLYVTKVVQGPSNVGSVGFVPPAHQTPSHVPYAQQRVTAETGEFQLRLHAGIRNSATALVICLGINIFKKKKIFKNMFSEKTRFFWKIGTFWSKSKFPKKLKWGKNWKN